MAASTPSRRHPQTSQDCARDAATALLELCHAVRSREQPGLNWAVEHAPDGDLARLVRECNDAGALAELAELLLPAREAVALAIECVETLRPWLPLGDPRVAGAIDAARAWRRGDAVDANAASLAANEAYTEACHAVPGTWRMVALRTCRDIHFAIMVAEHPAGYAWVSETVRAVAWAHAQRDAASAGPIRDAMCAQIRARLPAPALDALLGATRR